MKKLQKYIVVIENATGKEVDVTAVSSAKDAYEERMNAIQNYDILDPTIRTDEDYREAAWNSTIKGETHTVKTVRR